MRTNTRIFPRIFPRLFRREDDLAGFGLVDSGAFLVFHAAWADAAGVSQTLLTGTGPVTTDHAEAILAPYFEGVYREFAVDEPVWAYGRVVTNDCLWSEDFTQQSGNLGDWKPDAGVTLTHIAPNIGEIEFDESVFGCFQEIAGFETLGSDIIFRVEMRTDDGPGEVDGRCSAISTILSLTSEWQVFTWNVRSVYTGQGFYVRNSERDFDNKKIQIRFPQVEDATGRSDTTTPSEYIATTTAAVQKVFNYANVNTVDGNGVVTEARGADFADAPYLVATDAGTNSQIQSNDQTNVEYTATNVTVAQDESGFATGKDACTLTATAANGTVIANAITAASGEHAAKWYIKRKTGTGDIDLTLDNGTGWTTVTLTSDFGLFAIDQAALTNPQIGIRIVTDTDAVIVGNAECHLTSTVEQVKSLGPIFTTSGTATTSAFDNEYPAANHSNTEGPYYLEFENTGDDVVLAKAGTDEFLKITSNQIVLDDGTTQISTACAAGEHKVGIAYAESRGDELVTNGTFADGTTGWALGTSGATVVAGELNWPSLGIVAQNLLLSSFPAGTELEFTIDVTTNHNTAGHLKYYNPGNAAYVSILGTGSLSFTMTSDGAYNSLALRVYSDPTVPVVFDNISVKAVTNKMNLNLDGTWADLTDSTAYDGTLGSGVLTLGETERNVKRWNETDLTKQKDIIDEEMA